MNNTNRSDYKYRYDVDITKVQRTYDDNHYETIISFNRFKNNIESNNNKKGD